MSKETLYELADKFQFLYNFDFQEEESEDWLKAMEEVDAAIEEKADNIARFQKNRKANIEARKAEIKRLQDLNKRDERALENTNHYLKDAMEVTGKRKFKTELFSFYIKQNPLSLNVETEKYIDDEYFKIEKKLDKCKLLADIKEGLVVDGVTTMRTESLVIR